MFHRGNNNCGGSSISSAKNSNRWSLNIWMTFATDCCSSCGVACAQQRIQRYTQLTYNATRWINIELKLAMWRASGSDCNQNSSIPHLLRAAYILYIDEPSSPLSIFIYVYLYIQQPQTVSLFAHVLWLTIRMASVFKLPINVAFY